MGNVSPGAAPAVPDFLPLAGHPLRWHLLCALARSDCRVRELTEAVGEPQNLVSYHLGRLREGRLVTTRRSSADGRDTYYSLDLAHCGALLAAAGGALHPALRLVPPGPGLEAVPPRRRRVLFLCTGNSARSQIAEGFLRHLSDGLVEVRSAGSDPGTLHPDAVRVMAEHGVDISAGRAKHLREFRARRFSHVVTLCDRVREICPEFPGPAERIHWSLADPAREADGLAAFRRTATELRGRVGFLLYRLAHPSNLESV